MPSLHGGGFAQKVGVRDPLRSRLKPLAPSPFARGTLKPQNRRRRQGALTRIFVQSPRRRRTRSWFTDAPTALARRYGVRYTSSPLRSADARPNPDEPQPSP